MKNPYLNKELKYFMHTFNRQPLLIKRAKGSRVWDAKGKSYLDFYSGLAVCGVGHNNERVVNAIRSQATQLLHSSNFFYTQPQFDLAENLTARWPKSRVFFTNSGGEANELAFKLARLWATKNKKPGRDIISFTGGFHGRTLATTAASNWHHQANKYFDPLPVGFKSVPFNDVTGLKAAVTKNTIAFIVEAVQGEGGIHVATKEFLQTLARLCRQKNLLLIMDEIQSGLGRTGKFFGFEHSAITPDIVTLAKGLAGGLPLGATLAQPQVAKHMVPGLHGSTFGGNPVACAASLEVLKLLTPELLKSIGFLGREIKQRLNALRRYSVVKGVRGLGLMLALELHVNGTPYVNLARERGLLINCTQGTVLRFLPPYFMSHKDMLAAMKILESVIKTLQA